MLLKLIENKIIKKLTCAEIPPIKKSSNENKMKLKTILKQINFNSPTSNKSPALLELDHGAQGWNVMTLGT